MGVTLELTNPEVLQQNGFAERSNRTILETTRVMRIEATLQNLWRILYPLASATDINDLKPEDTPVPPNADFPATMS